MRIAIAVLVVSSLVLGCSSDSSKNGAAAPLGDVFDKGQVPEGAKAPNDYLTSVFNTIKGSAAFVPSEAAIFDIIDDDGPKYLYEGSTERIEAKKRLNAEGLAFLKVVRRDCLIKNAQFTNSGEVGQGNTVVESHTMAAEGANCPYLISEVESQETFYETLQQTENSGYVKYSFKGSSEKTEEIKNEAMVNASGILSYKFSFTTTGQAEGWFTKGEEESRSAGTVNMAGSLELALANGDVIKGPVKVAASVTNERSELHFLFDGTSTQGIVRIVVTLTTVKGQKPVPEIHVNGEKIDPSVIEGLQQLEDATN